MKRLRVGIISFAHMHGLGYWWCCRDMPDLVEFVGFWDPDRERAARIAKEEGIRAFESRDELLARVDAAIVTSENTRHRDDVVACARAGVHVLCEKPLATRMEDARAMLDAVRRAGVSLGTAFPCRYLTPFARARELYRSGRFGRVAGLCGTNHGTMPGGWFVEPELSGGGALFDHTVHVADLVRWITGEEFSCVWAEAATRIHPGLRVEDCGAVFFTLTGGAFGTIDFSWSRNPAHPTWGDVTLSLVCERGVISVDGFRQRLHTSIPSEGKHVEHGWGDNMDLGLLRAWVRAVLAGDPPPVTGEDGARATELAVGAYRAVASGEPVRLPL